jgi:tyrosine-protein kinase Etk/Wzc
VVVGLGTFLGLLVGVGVVMLRRSLNHGVENPQEVESAVGLPVLITIPHSRLQALVSRHPKEASPLLAIAHPEDMAVESLRSLRTSLPFTLVDVPNRVVVIAGPSPDIGKSFVSTNFATVLAQGGSHVLLIDADLRRGKLHRILGFEERTGGLSEVLSGQMDWKSALRESNGFQLISSGFLPPNPSELLMGPRLGAILEEAARQFDFILIDTPPLLAVTDAVLVGSHAGSVLLTLKAGQHSMEEIRTAIHRLENADIRPKGVIFNDLQPMSAKYGYHAYAYRKDSNA